MILVFLVVKICWSIKLWQSCLNVCSGWLNIQIFLSTDVYIGGDLYSGITIPAIVQEISLGKRLVCDSTCTAKLEWQTYVQVG